MNRKRADHLFNNVISSFTKYKRNYGDKVAIYIGLFPNLLLVSDLGLISHILSSKTILKKGREYQFMTRWLGNGLIISDGDSLWKKHRKIITPSFHIEVFREFIKIFEFNTKILIEKLETELDKPSFNIQPYISLCSLDIICGTTMGTSVQAQEYSHSNYVKSVKFMCNMLTRRSFHPLYTIDFCYIFSKLYREEKRALYTLHTYTKEVIAKRKMEYKTNKNNTADGIERKPKKVLLDLLLEQNEISETFTDEEIEEEVNTFMFAGHDTTASAVTFAIFTLAENPEVQAKVANELEEIFIHDKHRAITLNDVQSMKYLEAVVKEVIRLYPPVPYISRTVEKDFEFDGCILPEGVTIVIDIIGTHRNPKLFSEPEKFKPDRFLTENVDERVNNSYIPFSVGPRNCIGQKFAMIEIKTVLAMLLRHYKFQRASPEHQLNLVAETVLVSNNGVYVSMSKRN